MSDVLAPSERFKIGHRYEWEGCAEMVCVGFTPQGNAAMVYTEDYGKERAFVIERYHLEEYVWRDVPVEETTGLTGG